MSMIASTCSMSTGHSSTHAPHVVQLHSTSGSMTRGTSVLAVVRVAGEQLGPPRLNRLSRSPMMSSFGLTRLARVPRRALRLAPAALGAGGEVEHLLPGELADVADAEDGVLGHVLHVHVRGLVEPAERARAPRGCHVDRARGRCAGAWSTTTKTRNDVITAMLSRRKIVSIALFAVVPSGASQVGDGVARERPARGRRRGSSPC